ncbi:SufB/SufD family protein [Spiroplasma culicicola]|uniref:FeS assembly protein SufD n=1 Tax=Spiroplasma culicicola AES-1 TaxID=1276246 RepID=W6AHG6_9MOLU|nr:SufD family Fe-S cluster assembly protein [Spiroplasma culicicola]AHI53149.1 FeS assembly protein SufD [Spiroplasma culicicola AES-1]
MIDTSKINNLIDLREQPLSNIDLSQTQKTIILLQSVDGQMDINIQENAAIDLTIIFLQDKQNNKKFDINFNLKKYAQLKLYIANLGDYNCDDNITVNLNEENSGVQYYSASILNQTLKKNSVITVRHLQRATTSDIKAYEVLKNKSQGFIRCVSDIRHGSSSSEAHQELRLLVLDKEAKADSDPVLLIDENDIVASHANAIGMLDPDQVFYLSSRGLKKEQAEELIVNGYFEPIFLNFENEYLETEMKKMLKGMI